jgi:uncharacterized protein YndB with AHSA1/START domain
MGYSLSIEIKAPLSQVWHSWTSSQETCHWLAPRAEVEFYPGGAYEFFWGDDPEKDSTIGCKLIELEPERFLKFEWQGLTQFLYLFTPPKGKRTTIEVRFLSRGSGTIVTLSQPETRPGKDWTDYETWMSRAWRRALEALKDHCERRLTSSK